MYVVFLAGGIASGKSSVARELAVRGACLVDLDVLSREATTLGSPTNALLAQEFGADVIDETGALRRDVLAKRAFASSECTQRLEEIVHPAIRRLLTQWIRAQDDSAVCVVEIPLLDRVEDLIPSADEVLCVVCPVATRRVRAVGRGMDARDFDARVRQQPTDDYLVAHATTVFNNKGDESALVEQIDNWWRNRCQERSEFRRSAIHE